MKKNVILMLGILTGTLFLSHAVYARYDPSVKWHVIHAKNFTIYYPEGHELFAGRVLSLSDEVFDDITGYFGVFPRKLPVVLHPQTDMFNGFYSPFPNRISLFETPIDDFKLVGNATHDLVDYVFTHEYVHYTHITTTCGLYGFLTRIFGRGLGVANGVSPGWAIEGVTTNLETKFTNGGRGRSPYFRGIMRSFSDGKGLWSLSAAGMRPPYAPPSSRIYLSGYFMVEYLNRTYGDDTFARINLSQARHPLRGTGRALRKVTGKSPRAFYHEFLEDFTSRCDSIKTVQVSDNLPAGKTLVSEPLDGYTTHFWTKKNTIMALRSGYENLTALVEIDPASGEMINQIKTGLMNNFNPVRMFPDGRLFFGEAFFHPLGEGELDVSDLVVFDPVTRQRERLTQNAHIFSADISPDGTHFAAVRRNGLWSELILMEKNGTGIRTLVSRPGVYFESPVFAPAGKTIASTANFGGKSCIALVDAETGEIRTEIDSDVHGDSDPTFSPDGRWLVFTSARNGTWNIHAWDMSEHRLFRLTSVFTGAIEPRISPDGSTLSFLVIERGLKRIRVMPFKPQEGSRVLISGGGDIDEPDTMQVQFDISQNRPGIPIWEAYKPFIHMPYYAEDRDGSAIGAYFMGGDPLGLNTYDASIFYGNGSNLAGYNINVTNKNFWPALRINVNDFTRRSGTLTGGENYWFREKGGEFAFSLNVLHKTVPNIISASYESGARFRRFSDLESAKVDMAHYQSFSLYAGMFIRRKPDSAHRDMVPGWGQEFYIGREEEITALGGEIKGHNKGHNIVCFGRQYIPSPLKHHGFELAVAYQNQRGALYFPKYGYIPRGYYTDDAEGGLDMSKTATLSLEYRFPILFVDKGIGLYLIHANLVRGSVFTDYGAGWSGNLGLSKWGEKARSSVGITVTAQTYILSLIPLEFGIRTGYKPRDNEGFTQFIIDVWGNDFVAQEKDKKRFSFIPWR